MTYKLDSLLIHIKSQSKYSCKNDSTTLPNMVNHFHDIVRATLKFEAVQKHLNFC